MEELFSAERPFECWDIRGFNGKSAHLFAHIDSTHRYGKEHLQSLEAGDVIVADSQSGGRGRHNRVWISPANKNLYFNILYPLKDFAPREYPQLMQITAISIAQVFREIGIDASVKWPNDILCGAKKVCGMISEILNKNGEKLITIGIGIDVNADERDLECIDRPVASLLILLGKKLNREILLRTILQKLRESLEITKREGVLPWIGEWRKMDKFIGNPAKIVEGDIVIPGTILDINDDGSLLFCTESGEIVTRHTGDLEI